MKFDVIYYDTASSPFSRRLVTSQPSGGSEINHVKIVHGLSDAGYSVLVLNNLDRLEVDGGVVYDNFRNDDVECEVLVLSRFADRPPRIHANRMVMAANDQFQQWQRPKYIPGTTLVVNSPWHAQCFPADWKTAIVPAIIPQHIYDRPRVKKDPNKFVYASAVCKGLRETLKEWQTIKVDHPHSAELYVTTAGHDALSKETIESFGAHWLGELSPSEVEDQLADAAGIFFVNTLPETFCVIAAVAEALGCRCHIWTKAGGAIETTVQTKYWSSNQAEFRKLFIDNFPFEARGIPHDFSPSKVIPMWIDVLGLKDQRVLTGVYRTEFYDFPSISEPPPDAPAGTHFAYHKRMALESLQHKTDPDSAWLFAEHCRLALMPERALTAYLRRGEMSEGDQEQRFDALMQAAQLQVAIGLPEVTDTYRAASLCGSKRRFEAVVSLTQYYRAREMWQDIYDAIETTVLRSDSATIGLPWQIQDEWAIACYWLNEHEASEEACRMLLERKDVPESEKHRIRQNLQFAFDALRKDKFEAFAKRMRELPAPAPGLPHNWTERCAAMVERAQTDPQNFLVWNGDVEAIEGPPFLRWYEELRNSPEWSRWERITRKTDCRHHSFSADYGASPQTIQHAFALKRYEEHMGRFLVDIDVVVEVGGGSGSFARMLRLDGFRGRYIIVDLPHVREIQRLYAEINNLDVELVTEDELPLKLDKSDRVAFVAMWSLSETPMSFREKLFPALHAQCAKYLITTQWDHPAWPGAPQYPDYFDRFMNDSGAEWTMSSILGGEESRFLFGKKVTQFPSVDAEHWLEGRPRKETVFTRDFVRIIPNALPLAFCEGLQSYFDSCRFLGLTHRMNENWRRCTICPLPHADMAAGQKLVDRFVEVLRPHFDAFKQATSNALGNVNRIEIPSLVLYEPSTEIASKEHFAEHADSWNEDSHSRQVSVIAYLNDVEEGGETVFPHLGITVEPKAGTLLLFPSAFTHTHRAEPPVSGDKLCLITWLHFPGGKYGTFPL